MKGPLVVYFYQLISKKKKKQYVLIIWHVCYALGNFFFKLHWCFILSPIVYSKQLMYLPWDRRQQFSYSGLLVPLGFDVLSFLFYSGAQSLMSSNPMLGCNTGAIAPAGINLSGILPPGGLVPSALPAAMQSASQAGQCDWVEKPPFRQEQCENNLWEKWTEVALCEEVVYLMAGAQEQHTCFCIQDVGCVGDSLRLILVS